MKYKFSEVDFVYLKRDATSFEVLHSALAVVADVNKLSAFNNLIAKWEQIYQFFLRQASFSITTVAFEDFFPHVCCTCSCNIANYLFLST